MGKTGSNLLPRFPNPSWPWGLLLRANRIPGAVLGQENSAAEVKAEDLSFHVSWGPSQGPIYLGNKFRTRWYDWLIQSQVREPIHNMLKIVRCSFA